MLLIIFFGMFFFVINLVSYLIILFIISVYKNDINIIFFLMMYCLYRLIFYLKENYLWNSKKIKKICKRI